MFIRCKFLFGIACIAVFLTITPSLFSERVVEAARAKAKSGAASSKKRKSSLAKRSSPMPRAEHISKSSRIDEEDEEIDDDHPSVQGTLLPNKRRRRDVGELPRPSGRLWIFTVNQREELRVNLYKDDGSFDDEALAQLDHQFRCRRTGEERAVDPKLYEMLSRVQDRFGGKRIHLISGFRFQRNEGSRHYHASAMDIRIPGVSIRRIRRYVDSVDGGNMGIGFYPRANFVHIDFRAPGESSQRWVDRSRSNSGSRRGKRASRRSKYRSRNS